MTVITVYFPEGGTSQSSPCILPFTFFSPSLPKCSWSLQEDGMNVLFRTELLCSPILVWPQTNQSPVFTSRMLGLHCVMLCPALILFIIELNPFPKFGPGQYYIWMVRQALISIPCFHAYLFRFSLLSGCLE